MRKLVLAACLALLPLGCDSLHPEATYDGVTTSDWIEYLHDETNTDRRVQAATALGELGLDEAGDTVPELAKAVGDPQPRVRLAALQSLQKLAPKARKAQGAVGRAISDKNKVVAKQAMKTFRSIELAKPSAIN
jgi:HEAT repeat protein